MAKKTLTQLEADKVVALENWKMRQVEIEIASIIKKLAEREAHDEVNACEDAIVAEKARLKLQIGHVVLAGEALIHDLAYVQAEVKRSEQILKDRLDADAKTFACRRIERALIDLEGSIRNAKPISEEKERLQFLQISLKDDYAEVINPGTTPSGVAFIIERINQENEVDAEWLKSQKEELERTTPVRAPLERRVLSHSIAR